MKARLVAAVLCSLIVVPPTVAHAATPITGDNRPTSIAGATNGELPASDLIRVTANCQVARAAGPSLSLLLASARARNITVSTTECYRPVSGQVAVSKSWTNQGNSACAAAPSVSPTGKVAGTSMHGWGKAADLGFGGGSFGSAGYRYLKSVAGAYGWNHPAWAEPGGSACPEAWHWEWVGDGGQAKADTVRADVIGMVPSPDDKGYATVNGLGAVSRFGNAIDHGDASALPLNWVMVGSAATPDRNGYWLVGADGGIFSYGNAAFYGSTGSMRLNQPVVAMTPTPSGKGYWMVAADGGVFSYGDAAFYGSTGSMKLNSPVVSIAATATGKGYWLVAADGGIFAFGDARFNGSLGSTKLNQPVAGMIASGSGNGYLLVASDGGVFAFGDAVFRGSTGANPPAQPVVAITPTAGNAGYWMTVANGDVLPFGGAAAFPAR